MPGPGAVRVTPGTGGERRLKALLGERGGVRAAGHPEGRVQVSLLEECSTCGFDKAGRLEELTPWFFR